MAYYVALFEKNIIFSVYGGSKYNNPVLIKKRNLKKRFSRIITHGLIDFVKETIFLKIWSWDHGPKPEFIHIFKKVRPDPVTNEVGL